MLTVFTACKAVIYEHKYHDSLIRYTYDVYIPVEFFLEINFKPTRIFLICMSKQLTIIP